MSNELFLDEPVVVSFFIGELGWFLQRWQGYLRYLKREKFPNHKFLMIMNTAFHVFVHDFVACTVGLPKEFYDLGLETDCYESPTEGSPPGSLTPSYVWSALVEYARSFYNPDKAIEVWPPRGVNMWVDKKTQIFKSYSASKRIHSNKPIVCVFPRGRARAAARNVPEFVWYDLVEKLKHNYQVVLGGTPNGSCLVDYNDDDVINLIPAPNENKLDTIIEFLGNAVCSISSQSGLTHVSLLSMCPTIVIGHEKKRHSEDENRTVTPVSFRYVTDYRAIDADTIIKDMLGFFDELWKRGYRFDQKTMELRPSLREIAFKQDLVGAEIGVFDGKHAYQMLELLNIKKLYLIDPYKKYDGCDVVSGFPTEEAMKIRDDAYHNLEVFKDKIVWIEDLSENAIEHIDEKLDFVYIDGNHKYDYVMKDIKLYSPKVKDGGLIAGHDYENADVCRAVNEVFTKIASGVDPEDSKIHDWWIFKPFEYDNILQADSNILMNMVQL